MSITAGEVMDMSASLLNDTAKTVYTYTAQMPYLNMAYRELGELLELNNIPVTNATSAVIPIIASGDNIGGSDTPDAAHPALPDGLVEIQQLWQRPTGTDIPFLPISKYEFLPHFWDGIETSVIPAWAWMEQIIKFIPSNTPTDVKIDYIKTAIITIEDEDDDILIINAFNTLGFRTAGLCARFIGENPTRADTLDSDAVLAFERMLGMSNKGRQSIVTRRRPFMASYKNRGMI